VSNPTEFAYPRMWKVRIYVPADPDNNRKFSRNEFFNVVALSLERAMEAIRAKHPVCRFESITCDHEKVLVIDPPIVAEVAERLEKA